MAEISLDLIKKIRRIQYQTTKLADDILAGAYRSAFRGKGMEFEEVREYQQGDEVRTIDWNVTARMNRPFVKSFREERDMTVLLAVDISASTRFGSGHGLKKDLIAELAAVLAFSAIKNNDRVGLILFSNIVEKYIPPRTGTRHVLRVIRELLAYRAVNRGTDVGAALSFLSKVQRRSCICFLISDFICPDYSREAALAVVNHDIVSIAIVDPFETKMLPMDLLALSDLESGKTALIDSSSPLTQQHLQEQTKQRLVAQKKLMEKIGGDFLAIHSEEPYLPQLRKFFAIRQKRQR
jgi:uncharacterized protein (DUF58 family)